MRSGRAAAITIKPSTRCRVERTGPRMVRIIMVLIILDRCFSLEVTIHEALGDEWTRNARAAYTRGRNVRYEYDQRHLSRHLRSDDQRSSGPDCAGREDLRPPGGGRAEEHAEKPVVHGPGAVRDADGCRRASAERVNRNF